MIANVNEERVREGFDTDPVASVLHQESIDTVLEEDGEKAKVRVDGEAGGPLGLWTWRVYIASKKLERGLEVQGLGHVILL